MGRGRSGSFTGRSRVGPLNPDVTGSYLCEVFHWEEKVTAMCRVSRGSLRGSLHIMRWSREDKTEKTLPNKKQIFQIFVERNR